MLATILNSDGTSGFEVGNITKVWYATLNWVVPTSGFVANAAFTDSIRLSKHVVRKHACYTHWLLSTFYHTNEDGYIQSIPGHPNQSHPPRDASSFCASLAAARAVRHRTKK